MRRLGAACSAASCFGAQYDLVRALETSWCLDIQYLGSPPTNATGCMPPSFVLPAASLLLPHILLYKEGHIQGGYRFESCSSTPMHAALVYTITRVVCCRCRRTTSSRRLSALGSTSWLERKQECGHAKKHLLCRERTPGSNAAHSNAFKLNRQESAQPTRLSERGTSNEHTKQPAIAYRQIEGQAGKARKASQPHHGHHDGGGQFEARGIGRRGTYRPVETFPLVAGVH